MGWGSRSPGRRDEHRSPRRRSRSRSSSRERGRRRYSRSRSRSRDRWREDRSRSRERRLRDSRSVSPPTHHHHYEQQHQQQYPSSSWQAGPEVPRWRQQQPLPGIAPLVVPAPWHNTDRMGSHHPHRGHQWERSRSRGSDTDRDWAEAEEQQQAHNRPPSGRQEVPSASVFIKGLPPDADEGDVITAFACFANIQSVKVLRDRVTGRGKGTAFLDFASVDDARVLMQSDARYNTVVGGQPLYLDYSSGPPGGSSTAGLGGTAPGGGAVALDWICDRCTSVNFSRRLECYQCSTARPANPRRVASDLNEPSHILKVSGLEPHTSEEALYSALAAVVPNIVDMRVIKDKFTGAPRGFAFVELPSVSAAGTLMMACQGMMLRGQATPLKACYAKTKDRLLGSAITVEGPGGDAAAAATAAPWAGGGGAVSESQPHSLASGPLGWKPKEFNPDGTASSGKQQQDGQLTGAQAAAAAAAGGGAPDTSAGAAGGGGSSAAAAAPAAAAGPGPGSEADASGAAAAAAAGVDAATIQAMTQAGFQFQASSGYWWDPKSGYFFDTKTQLYYHHSTAQWYQYCHDTGQYTAVVSGADQQQQQQQQGLQQQQQQPQKQASVADKRRRAVIGSAAQYNPEGLLAAAALAEEREAEQRRIAAAKAARERQQQQQNKGSSNNKKQQQMMPGKPGIGMLPGTGTSAAAFAAVASSSAQVVEQGNVQGVVYRSKWQQRGAAQQ